MGHWARREDGRRVDRAENEAHPTAERADDARSALVSKFGPSTSLVCSKYFNTSPSRSSFDESRDACTLSSSSGCASELRTTTIVLIR